MDLGHTLLVNLVFNLAGRIIELAMLWMVYQTFKEMGEIRRMLRDHRRDTEPKE